MTTTAFLFALLLGACCGYTIGEFKQVDHSLRGSVHVTTFLSPPLVLQPGWVIQSDPSDTPMKMPASGYITGFYAEVVDENQESVLLSEVYLHHWILYDSLGNGGPCESLQYVLGVGAETRGTPINFPSSYGIKMSPEMNWAASIHVLRTTDVQNVKHCIECHCPGGDNAGGGLQCCPTTVETNVSCALIPGSPTTPKTYYLRYKVSWQEAADALTPLTIFNFDVTDCNFQYNVPQCVKGQECVYFKENSYTSNADGKIMFLAGHMHIGGINVTFSVNDKPIYTAYPRYGNGTLPGNEKDYLVAISTHAFAQPYPVKNGDKLTLSAHYKNDVYHDGVMGLCLMAAVPTGAYDNFQLRKL